MKLFRLLFVAELAAALGMASAQVFAVDQRSENIGPDGGGISTESLVQSFTPAAATVGFVEIFGYDYVSNDGGGGTLALNLRADTYDGPIIGVSSNVVYGDNARGWFRFLFPTNITVAPEKEYFLEPFLRDPAKSEFIVNVEP